MNPANTFAAVHHPPNISDNFLSISVNMPVIVWNPALTAAISRFQIAVAAAPQLTFSNHLITISVSKPAPMTINLSARNRPSTRSLPTLLQSTPEIHVAISPAKPMASFAAPASPSEIISTRVFPTFFQSIDLNQSIAASTVGENIFHISVNTPLSPPSEANAFVKNVFQSTFARSANALSGFKKFQKSDNLVLTQTATPVIAASTCLPIPSQSTLFLQSPNASHSPDRDLSTSL